VNEKDNIPDLKQNLWTHTKEAVYDAECEDEGHAINVQTQEPWQRSYTELNIDVLEMIVDDWEALVNQGFKHTLV